MRFIIYELSLIHKLDDKHSQSLLTLVCWTFGRTQTTTDVQCQLVHLGEQISLIIGSHFANVFARVGLSRL